MGSGGSSTQARQLSEAQQKKAEAYMQQWMGTPAKAAYTSREWVNTGSSGFAGGGGVSANRGPAGSGTGYWKETQNAAVDAVEGLGIKYNRKQKREIDRGFTKARGEMGVAGESRRQDIGETGQARRAGMESSLIDRGIGGSSLGVQADALIGNQESAERDQLANTLAGQFSSLELGRSQSLAGADAAYSASMLDASGAIAGMMSNVSYQGGGGSPLQAVAPILGGILGGSDCCFIMLEGRYGDGTMDDVVRRFRDEAMTERNRRGYYKVAEVLVPLMRKSRIAKWLVQATLCNPLVSYGKWYYGENRHGWLFAPVKSAWLGLFHAVGGETEFVRENGEYV